ncbi:hypothetical protein BS47DRAFT_1342059 [Hydnum rufescens UP504]|uniref:Uncharacterized protein n=1 Tax=Hydnum rufescens UP504 TaxID=1448309 RepID=A0A9P6B0Q9_9AGAM|nr:hypothetical protein BS47DRAFT_1342059 [Hydnum rufescens UP504]
MNTKSGSADRTRRVAGAGKYEESASAEFHVIKGDPVLGEPALFVNDPAVTVVRCAECVFLAVIQVTQITVDSLNAPSIIESLLHDRRVCIRFQILCEMIGRKTFLY